MPGHPAAPGNRNESASRVAALTGLRGLAALSVIVYHVWQYGTPTAERFTAGPFGRVFENIEVGVTFFFVLSGFLLYRPYARALVAGRSWPSLRKFAIARFLRIVPTYWAAVLVVAALTERWLFGQPERLLANLTFLEFFFPGFLPRDMASGNGSLAIVVSWSLVAEAGFYVALPLVAAVAVRTFGRRGRPVAAAFLPAVLLGAVGIAAMIVEHWLAWRYVRSWDAGFPMHGAQFGAGMGGAVIWVLREHGRLRLPRLWQPAALGVALAIALGANRLYYDASLSQAAYQSVLAVSSALFLLVVVLSPAGGRLRSVLGARVFVVPGLASYSLFLVHDPIIRALRTENLVGATPSGFVLTLAIVGAATALAATVSYRLLEKPCLALKQRLTATPDAQPARAERAVEPLAPMLEKARS